MSSLNAEEEKEAQRNYDVRISDGLGRASKQLMDDAIKYFKRGTKDDIANILRTHAQTLKLASAKVHPGPTKRRKLNERD